MQLPVLSPSRMGHDYVLPPQEERRRVHLQEDATKMGNSWWPLFMYIPDLRQQRWQLLVLESQCKDLLRVHRAEGAQAHQLHEHSWEAELVLQGEKEAGMCCWGHCPARPAKSVKSIPRVLR